MADNTSASSKMEPLEVEFPNTDNTNSSSDRVVLLGGNSSLNLMDEEEQFGLNTTPGKCISTCRPCCKYMPCYPGVNEVNIFTPGNIAIPVFYCMLGFLLKFPYVALRYYLIETIKATPSQQAIVYSVVMGMPWNFKMIYGFISDTCPIRGRRRKPYMFGGTICCSISWLMFGSGILGSPGMGLMCVLLFTAIFGMIFADVMADALVVERMKGEQSDKKGGIQSTCWMLRFSGSFFGFVMGAVFMDGFGFHPQAIFFLQGLVPLVTMLPPLYLLNDPVVDGYQGKWVRSTELGNAIGGHAVARRSVKEEALLKLNQVWDCIQMNHIWMPMSFIFVFAATPNNSDSFSTFLIGPLCFSKTMYSSIMAIGMLASLGGALKKLKKL